MKKQPAVFRKALLFISLFIILMCPMLFIGGMFFPASIGFLEPIICPSGMHLDQLTESISDPRGNVSANYLVCADGVEQVDVTGKMLIILFGIAILGVGLLVTWALTGASEETDAPAITLDEY